jgi:hypothetical protein
MDRALLVECSDEINEAASPPREEELFRELDGKVETIAEVVDGLKAAVSAIPDIQDDIEQIKKTLAELVSCSKSILMAFGSSAAKEVHCSMKRSQNIFLRLAPSSQQSTWVWLPRRLCLSFCILKRCL